MKMCPYCSNEMEVTAVVCQHCRRDWKTGAATDQRLDNRTPLRWGTIIAATYLTVVAAALVASSRAPNGIADAMVIYLTMPLSLVISMLFAWSVIHGADVGPMLVMLAISAVVNAFVIVWGSAGFPRRRSPR
jgi:hypothetical protein